MGMRAIKRVVVHCSDSDDSLDIGRKEIDGWHKQRGFVSPTGIHIGYHWVVRRDGSIEAGRPESEVGAHVKGHNSNTIGVVWVGRKAPSAEQYRALLNKLRDICDRYKIKIENVVGHRELSPDLDGDGTVEANEWTKTCPNLDTTLLRADLLFTKGN